MKCTYCNCKADVPMVDIGVGEQQCGPAECPNCGAAQDHNGVWHPASYWLQRLVEDAQ